MELWPDRSSDETILEYEAPFDGESVESAAPLIPSGYYRFEQGMYSALAKETGAPKTLLTTEQEAVLAHRIQTGLAAKAELEGEKVLLLRHSHYEKIAADGMQARNTLVECNMRLAAYYARASMNILPPSRRIKGAQDRVAPLIDAAVENDEDESSEPKLYTRMPGAYGDITKLRSRYAELEDRSQVAMIGLIKAAEKFEPRKNEDGKNVAFANIARYYIHCELSRYASTEALGHTVPEGKISEARKGRDDEDLWKREQYRQILERRDTVPLDTVHSNTYAAEEDEGDGSPLELLPVSDLIRNWDEWDVSQEVFDSFLEAAITEALNTLSEREEGVVRMRSDAFGSAKATLEDIGKVYGVTRERIRVIESKAMGKLRHHSRANKLRPFLEIPGDFPQSEALNTVELYYGVPNVRIRHTDYEMPEASSRRTLAAVSDIASYENDQQLTNERSQQAEQKLLGHRHSSFMMRRMMRYANPVEFTDTPLGDAYDGTLFDNIVDAFGSDMPSYYLEHGWGTILRTIPHWERVVGHEVTMIKIARLFSQLFERYVPDGDNITLRVPQNRADSLHYMGSGITKGTLTIVGNVGNYLGAGAKGSARIEVQGSAGDFAGAYTADEASINISGNAGKFLGFAATSGAFSVGGEVESALVPSKFRGEMQAAKIHRLDTF